MKTIIQIAIFTAILSLLPSCEEMSFNEYLEANGVIPDEVIDNIKPTKDGEVIETGVVDLGLSVNWAACNLEISTENHFADICTDKGSKFKWSYNNLTTPPEIISGSLNDNATVLLGREWRTPTKDEVQELINKCLISKKSYRGIDGCIVTGPSGKAIFFPEIADYNYWTGTYDLYSGEVFVFKGGYSFGMFINHKPFSNNNFYIRPVCGSLKY